MFNLRRCYNKYLLFRRRKIKYYLLVITCTLVQLTVIAEEKFSIDENWSLLLSGSFRGSLKTAGESFQINDIPDQSLANQTVSAAAYSTDYISFGLGIARNEIFSLISRVRYTWQEKYHLDLFPKSYQKKTLQLSDLYLSIPINTLGYTIWLGRRSFEFEEIYLSRETNPFNQVDLNGFGFETDVFQLALGANKESVYTTGKDQNGNQIIDQNRTAVLYENDDLVLTLFMSGKFLLSEGKLFEPILSLRAYQALEKDPPPGVRKDKVSLSSSFILGGIFNRPLSDGIKGTTTIWFSSLPADKQAKPTETGTSTAFYGAGRIPPNYPQNTIGIADSSEFLYDKYGGLITSLVLLNQIYASKLPVLHISEDEKSLQSDGKNESRTTNRVSVGLQPIIYLANNFQLGVEVNLNYVTKKLLEYDANSFIVTPILKYSFDKNERLKTKKYAYISMSYGIYDWKIKTFSDGSKTDKLFSTQSGIEYNF